MDNFTSPLNKRNVLPASLLSNQVECEFQHLTEVLKRYFAREEARRSAWAYLRGLLSPIERKNSWQLAEEAGFKNPYAFQYLLGRALWDADEVRDELQRYTFEHLGTRQGILAVDETGFLKKGKQSAGVAR